MSNDLGMPPYWAEALLRSFLRPSDRESTSGDLLEEYREARYPALGRFRANAWYLKHVLSVLLRVIWPCLVAVVALAALPVAMQKSLAWNFSPVALPGISMFHGVIYLWTGYYGSQRTHLIRTGTLAAAATSLFGVTFILVVFAIQMPGLVLVPFSKPFIFVILSVILLTAVGCGIVLGTIGGVVGRRFSRSSPSEVNAS